MQGVMHRAFYQDAPIGLQADIIELLICGTLLFHSKAI
jgi:hypothetical protein